MATAPFSGRASGTIVVLDAADGRVVHVLTVAVNPTTLTVDVRRGRVLVTDVGPLGGAGALIGDGRPLVLDARDGGVTRSIPLHGIPGEVAIDEGTGRLVVGSGTLPSVTPRDPWGWVPARLRGALPLPAPPSGATGGSVALIDLTR